MRTINIEATKYTPAIILEPSGSISIRGKSYPENTFEFYKPILEWIEEYFENAVSSNTNVSMEIIYFNSGSSKFFFDLFDLLDDYKSRNNIVINWEYDKDNEMAKEIGEDFIEDFNNLKINLIEK